MKKALRYQLSDLKLVFICYFAILLFIFAAGFIGLSIVKVNSGSGAINIGLSGAFVCLITGICMFSEHFLMLIQNGFSRKIFYKSSMCTIVILSIIFAATEGLMTKLIQIATLPHNNIVVNTSIQMIFPSLHEKLDGGTGFILNMILTALMTSCLFLLGYLIAGIFYRLPKNLKTPFAIGLPVTIFVILPVIGGLFPSVLYTSVDILLIVMGISSNNLFLTFLFFIIVFILLSAVSFSVVKRAEVK